MALTTTATRSTRKAVIERLNMVAPIIVAITPNKPNILYQVSEKCFMEDVAPLVCQLKTSGVRTSKTLIYCRYCKEVTEFYDIFKEQLGDQFTSPPGFLDMAKYRLVDMYMSVTAKSVKEQIVRSFCSAEEW